jgi:hypothetical protein
MMNAETDQLNVLTKMSLSQFSAEHIDAANKIIDSFNSCRWTILIAQMQSGKTFTFLMVCAEMIRSKMVDEVVIFSGNAEIDLKCQLKNKIEGKDDEFYKVYRKYLRIKLRDTIADEEDRIDESERLAAMIKGKIQLVWGTEMKKLDHSLSKTLFIWEEAHYAQNITQGPDKFLNKLRISADGDPVFLEEHGNFVLTVSATPFSELSDNIHNSPNKKVVYLKPGETYNSVKTIKESGRLKKYSNLEDTLTVILRNHSSSPKYGLVRITNKNEEKIKDIISRNGWNFVIYDSVGSEHSRKEADLIWQNMKNVPQKNTIILLRGKCRMGKNLEKRNVMFVMETAKNSQTDTILQGLLGRVCGYSQGSDQIDVYLPEKIVESGEIDRYIELVEQLDRTGKVMVIPRRANNIISDVVHTKTKTPIVPIVIKDVDLSGHIYKKGRRSVIIDVINKINNDTQIIDKTHPEQFNEIKDRLNMFRNRNYTNSEDIEVEVHNMSDCDNDKKDSWKVKFTKDYVNKIKNVRNPVPVSLHHSGVKKDANPEKGKKELKEGRIIGLFCYPKAKGNIKAGTVIVYGVTDCRNSDFDLVSSIPKTTKKEVFCHRLEDGTDVISNGGYTIHLPIGSAYVVSVMKKYILEFVDLSMKYTGSRCITSQWCDNKKEFKGILVNAEVNASLIHGGEIYNAVFEKGFELKLTEMASRDFSSPGNKRYASISW